ncbi:hypothetical protein FJZ26_02355 [Candidatus Parvarchaeota archaeon]|nr:hypothetical protein [Candidatus Parvarchaeota archaeon]
METKISVKDPLGILFVDGSEVDRQLLSNILLDYVRLDEKGGIYPMPKFYQQTNKNKILLLLLSKKALMLKTGLDEPISPAELSKIVDMPDGSLRPTLSILVDEKLVNVKDSKYAAISSALQRCARLLSIKAIETQAQKTEEAESASQGKKTSMRDQIESLMAAGKLEGGKSAREIYDMVCKNRPDTKFGSIYKVILDLVKEKRVSRENKEATWIYKKGIE